MRSELFENYVCKYCGNADAVLFERLEAFEQADSTLFYVCKCKKCDMMFSIVYAT
jgi:DNA-directed RNA polymerase subunit M/transcription elongation factor TFIIS